MSAPAINPDDPEEIQKILARMSADEIKELQELLLPRIPPGNYIPHTPHPPQQAFMCLRDKEVLFGGAAGGGKSDALLMAALMYADVPGYSALILRRTYADLVLPGAIMDRANTWLRGTDAKAKDGGVTWIFPSGARLTFGYLQRETDKYRYASAEYQFIGWDELTHFPKEDTYQYLFSRLRKPQIRCLVCNYRLRPSIQTAGKWLHDTQELKKPCGNPLPDQESLDEYRPSLYDGTRLFDIPLRMRAATNPGGPGGEWVKKRFIDSRTKEKNVVFVPSLLKDNPSLSREEYEETLGHLHPVDRERLLNGDWDVTMESGFFRREWWKYVDKFSPGLPRVRYWDMASTADGGDWTVGCLMARDGNRWYILDIVRSQASPYEVEKLVRATATLDGTEVPVAIEQEPGSSGVALMDHYRRNILPGYAFYPIRSTGAKIARATPLAAAAEQGYVHLRPAEWNTKLMDESSVFPEGKNDDIVDAMSGAHNFLASRGRSRIIA